MIYNGLIKKSRTLDLALVSQVVDGVAAGFLFYTPEQIGITLPIYAGVRMGINALQAYLRYKTNGPVGIK